MSQSKCNGIRSPGKNVSFRPGDYIYICTQVQTSTLGATQPNVCVPTNKNTDSQGFKYYNINIPCSFKNDFTS